MMSGLGIGAVVMPVAAQYLIGRIGWQLTYGAPGAGLPLFAVPIAVKFLKDRPEEVGVRPDRVRAVTRANWQENAGVSWTDAWHSRSFWLLLLSFILVSASVQACFTQMAAIVTDRGNPVRTDALASSLLGSGLLIARAGSGYLLDRFFARHVA